MDHSEIISGIKKRFPDFNALSALKEHPDELWFKIDPGAFRDTCLALHKSLPSPVMMLFCIDERAQRGNFALNCVFADLKRAQWVIVSMDIPQEKPWFDSLAKSMHSATLFEREIKEMFGVEPKGNPDLRRLNLHDEVWPQGQFPLRKDFQKKEGGELSKYRFNRVEGEGIFEVPVGPVHAGIIGPGHFRFSCAGEPIINLETRLGFTHRGVEKVFEGKSCAQAIRLAECVSGDSCFSHSLAFTGAVEKINGITPAPRTQYLRAMLLELERMYNHVNDIGGIALDVGFSFPAAYASVIKEALLKLNESLTGSRYLKNVNAAGGLLADMDPAKQAVLRESLEKIKKDFRELTRILNSSVSFMDRADTTGVLIKKTAEDLGVTGLAGRACGIAWDLRKYFPGVYRENGFKMAACETGDVLARLKVRISEFEESSRMIGEFSAKLESSQARKPEQCVRQGAALGYSEGWRGPVLYWVKTDPYGRIERCKIVDPSFHNWQALSYAVLGNIIPDFPLCNKSFDLSYSGNDL